MDILIFLLAFIVGLFGRNFLPSYFSTKGQNLATKEDVTKITTQIEEVKKIYRDQYDLSKAERGLYDRMVKTIYEFLSLIKKYEFENSQQVTKEIVLANPDLKHKYFAFIDASNEFIGKSYMFLKEENYKYLKDAINISSNFSDMGRNLLYAMRKSLYPDTMLDPENLKELKY
ncbi:MAG: hypothetical protein AAB424_03900 [Patescibacteria group bacterium]